MRKWLHFGPYRLDIATPSLFREGTPVPLAPKALEVLRLLAQAEGAIVTKETLLASVWPDTFVEETSITKNICDLRSALGKTSSNGGYIETFARRGYRLSVPVHIFPDGSPGRRTIAVLPFREFAPATETDTLGLRFADAVITKLAATRVFTVRPTAAIMRYLAVDGRADAARDLDVEFVVDGSVRQDHGRIRTTIQLLDAGGTPCWGETFDQDGDDAYSFAEELTGALTLFAGSEQHVLLSRRSTENGEAYRAYLRGRYYLGQLSNIALPSAIEFFRKAIRIDAEYALAHSGMAMAYAMMTMLGDGTPRECMPKARAAAAKALDLDESLVEAHQAMALVKWHYDFDWRWAEREFKTALHFQPEHPELHMLYALLLVEMDRGGEAIAEVQRANALAPESARILANVATVFYLSGRYDESIAAAGESLGIDPNSLRAYQMVGCALVQKARYDEAIQTFEEGLRVSPDAPSLVSSLGHAFGAAGRAREATELVERLRVRPPRNHFFEEALIEVALGDLPASLVSIHKAYVERQFSLVLLKMDPRFAPLRSESAFQEILERIGLGGRLPDTGK